MKREKMVDGRRREAGYKEGVGEALINHTRRADRKRALYTTGCSLCHWLSRRERGGGVGWVEVQGVSALVGGTCVYVCVHTKARRSFILLEKRHRAG